jgi:predicted choloylglycine hydrolase
MQIEKLTRLSLSGAIKDLGEEYAFKLGPTIIAFFEQEITNPNTFLNLAKSCQKYLKNFTPNAYSFLQGIAQGSELSLIEVILLSLHEEIYHLNFKGLGHCSMVGFAKQQLLGQNWDWPAKYFPWAGILHLSMPKRKKLLTYHYPGLPACQGLNSSGLGIVWTGAGYSPIVNPQAGVPTYPIILELLLSCSNVVEAEQFLIRTPRAGSFIFMLGDSENNLIVAEATPNKIFIEKVQRMACRANIFMSEEIREAGRQDNKTILAKKSISRLPSLQNIKAKEKAIKDALISTPLYVNVRKRGLTIDSTLINLNQKKLSYRRGLGGKWYDEVFN